MKIYTLSKTTKLWCAYVYKNHNPKPELLTCAEAFSAKQAKTFILNRNDQTSKDLLNAEKNEDYGGLGWYVVWRESERKVKKPENQESEKVDKSPEQLDFFDKL